jgi:hypothetical protein
MSKKDVIRDLRKALSLPEHVKDEQVLENTRGTSLRCLCEFRDLIHELLRAVRLEPRSFDLTG